MTEEGKLTEVHAYVSCKIAIVRILNGLKIKRNSGIDNCTLTNSFIIKQRELAPDERPRTRARTNLVVFNYLNR